MASDDWNTDVIHGGSRQLMHKLVRANNVQSCDAHNLRCLQALFLPELAHGWHHGVHRIHDQGNHCLRAVFGTGLYNVLGDASIDVQQILAVLARLARHTSRHEHKVAAGEALSCFLDGPVILVKGVAFDLALHVQMRQVRSHTLCRYHGDGKIVDTEFSHIGIHGHQHAQRLANATGAADDADFEVTGHHCRKTGLDGKTCELH
mmetsp:Transcript_30065/g.48222  ORF Transcript_30065/g.48222 Transcript_30065/m.48222 type:complete len:205 (+) Transcript_30065:461-1075(+)